jgi:hypothetical protein
VTATEAPADAHIANRDRLDRLVVSGAQLGVQAHLASPALAAMIESVAVSASPPRDGGWVKPGGWGLWTSSLALDVEGGPWSVSEWARWCHSEEFWTGPRSLWLLTPQATSRIVQIDSADDLDVLHSVYGRPSSYHESVLDWHALAADYDGVNLTDDGMWRTRFTSPGTYGWDCESTVWFRWAFDHVHRSGIVTIPGHEEATDGDR